MTTKKSKPASLTSSLLARKGEAEPATAPYSIPETGRQRSAESAQGKGNGNGGDLGHALSGLGATGEKPTHSEISENGMHSQSVRATEAARRPETPETDADASGGETPAVEPEPVETAREPVAADPEPVETPSEPVEVAPEPVEVEPEPVDVAPEPVEAAPRPVRLFSKAEAPAPKEAVPEEADAEESVSEESAPEETAEEIFLESAVAEEVTLDEAVIEAGIRDTGAAAAAEKTPPDASGGDRLSRAAVVASALDGDADDEPQKSEVDREAARDARLLRFVYAMAALTGIVAIVLYAGGWLRDSANRQTAEAPAVQAPAKPESTAMTETPAAAPKKESATETAGGGGRAGTDSTTGTAGAIPAAPPVAPVEEKSATAESGVTTGGPAKPATNVPTTESSTPEVAATPSAPSGGTATPETPKSNLAAAAPSTDTKPAGTAATGGSAPAAGESAVKPEAPAAATGEKATAKADAEPVVPTPAEPEKAPTAPVAAGPVREVPNMRVLAPAVGRPKPAEPAPPTASGTARTSPGSGSGDTQAGAAPGDTGASSGVPKVTAPSVGTQTASVPKARPKPAVPGGGRYRVQLASVSSEAIAKREWSRLQKAYPDVFGDKSLVVERKVIAGRGTFYRVQASSYASLDEARSVCAGMKAKNQGCLPIKR